MRSFNKIFCIGLNKTGTKSLHTALTELGATSLHFAPEGMLSATARQKLGHSIRDEIRTRLHHGADPLGPWGIYDAYSDIAPITKNFEIFDSYYAGSLFIYTDRDEEAWIRSRTRHVNRNLENQESGKYYGEFTAVDADHWRSAHRKHRERVMTYFRGRDSDFLRIRICDGEGFETLAPFLGVDDHPNSFPKGRRIDWRTQIPTGIR